jgi:RNA polymerase sigma factor (sigma-70 family)
MIDFYNERRLVELSQQKDNHALNYLLLSYEKDIYNVLPYPENNDPELQQNALMDARSAILGYKFKSNFFKYISNYVLRNFTRREIKKSEKKKLVFIPLNGYTPIDNSHNPLDQIIKKETIEIGLNLIRDNTKENTNQRKVLELYMKGYSNKEISKELGIDENCCTSTMYNITRKLKKNIGRVLEI